MKLTDLSRRDLLRLSTMSAASSMLAGTVAHGVEEPKRVRGKADSCIFLWLGGGAAHVDTFDPKQRGDGKKKAGSYYNSIPTAISGVKVCEHLKRTADRLDRCVIVRSLNHNVVDEHAAATNMLHTGRPVSGTITYPSIGSIVAHERGAAGSGVPAYVLVGYPNGSRGPGFLGAKYSYVYLTETSTGPTGLTPPAEIVPERRARREALLEGFRADFQGKYPDDAPVADFAQAGREAAKLAGPAFMDAFQLDRESSTVRASYGGEFGQRCLLARRLVERGVRFVEVSHNLNFLNGTGWDTHNEGQLHQHDLIRELDHALAGLIDDLQQVGRLDSTLVVVATEFGRPPEFDSGGGRGHQSGAFSGLLAGGGLKTGQVIGATDDLAKKIIDSPVSVPDFHATIYSALGINPSKDLTAGGRPVPITDHGRSIAKLFG
jgi:hypothetical protein